MGTRRTVSAALAACALSLAVTIAPAGAVSTRPDSAARVGVAALKHYSSCAKMHKDYPHGVGKKGARDHVSSGRPVTNFRVNTALYNANKARDRDKDGIACEAH